jgi:alpha-beta hydrolase superfamily lysophospholipase
VVVAHSYGALVLLYALASGGIQRENLLKIQRVVVLAPPYFGTTFALLGLARSGDCMRKAGDFLPSLMKTLFAFAANTPTPDELHCSGVRDIPESL